MSNIELMIFQMRDGSWAARHSWKGIHLYTVYSRSRGHPVVTANYRNRDYTGWTEPELALAHVRL